MKVIKNIRADIDKWFDENTESMINDLSRLIAVPSVYNSAAKGAPYGLPARKALDTAVEILKERGFESEIFRDCMAIADLDVADGATPEAGLLVHVDVVSATGTDWTSDPFTAAIRDGNIYGRGATDDKGPAIAAIYALAAARDISRANGITLSGGARLLVGSGEEIGCVDIARYLEENTPPKNTFSPDANYPVVNVEKGRFTQTFGAKFAISEPQLSGGAFVRGITGGATSNIVPQNASAIVAGLPEDVIQAAAKKAAADTDCVFTAEQKNKDVYISCVGVASHASRPENGNNAQTALITLLNSLPLVDCDSTRAIHALAELFPHGDNNGTSIGIAASDDVSGSLTLAFTCLEFTETDFTGTFDSRTPKVSDSQPIDDICRKGLAAHSITVTNSGRTHCHVTSADSPFVKTLLEVYEEFTGLPGECLALGGTTYAHDIEGAVAFGTEMPGANNHIHGADEFIEISNLVNSSKMFAAAILELCV